MHSANNWQCKQCSIPFRTQQGLKEHKVAMHGKDEESGDASKVWNSDERYPTESREELSGDEADRRELGSRVGDESASGNNLGQLQRNQEENDKDVCYNVSPRTELRQVDRSRISSVLLFCKICRSPFRDKLSCSRHEDIQHKHEIKKYK